MQRGRCSTRRLLRPAIVDSLQEARPARAVAQPGDVRRLRRQHPHDGAVDRRRSRGQAEAPAGFILAVALWLWFTVLFANFAEALAEGRSKAQAASLRGAKHDVMAKKLQRAASRSRRSALLTATELRKGDVVLVEAGDVIPADGEVIEGVASVDESAITGESAPVIRESGGDFSSVTGGTRVLSDWIVVRVTRQSGRGLPRPHDRDGRRREAPEDAERDRADDPAGRADARVPGRHRDAAAVLDVLASRRRRPGTSVTITALVALLVCLIPTTIGGLLSAIGVAGMSRMMQANVIATSGRAVEAAGDVDVLLLDKTGTITLGNRQASAFVPAPGVTEQQLADAAQLVVARRRNARRPQHRRAGQAALQHPRTRHGDAAGDVRRASPRRRA